MKRTLTGTLISMIFLCGLVCAAPVKQVAEFDAPLSAVGDEFGSAVAIQGNTAVVGAPSPIFGGGTGLVYVYSKSGNIWKQAAELGDGAALGDGLGTSVAIGGDTIAAGAIAGKGGNGSVFVFVKPPGGWKNTTTPAAELTIPNGITRNLLGTSVAVSSDGKTIVAGGPGQTGLGGANVFVEPEGGWVNMTEPAATLTSSSGFEVGHAVAMSGNTIVVGEADTGNMEAAYVFVEPAEGWVSTTQPNATLTGSDEERVDAFGHVVAISGKTVVAGSAHGSTGTAYVFVEPETGLTDMTQTAELTIQAKGDPGLSFAVAITGKVILASAPDDAIGDVTQGAIFGYVKPAGGWVNTSKPNGSVIASDGGADGGFGASLTVSGTNMVVGAPDKGGELQGAVYIFAAQ